MAGTMKQVTSQFAWMLFCNLILIIAILQRSQTNAAEYPSQDTNGNINWGMFDPISKMNLYTSFDDFKKPDVILDMAQGFVDFVVHGLPYEATRELLKDIETGVGVDKSNAWELTKGFIGVLVLVLIGILLFLLVPLIGLCFCCCRCCNNCGGKREQIDSNLGCKRATFSLIFVALIGILGAGMAFTNSANDFQRSTLDRSDEAFNSVSDGVLNYTTEVLKQVDFMVDVQYKYADELIRTSLTENTLATDVTDYINEELKLEDVTEDLETISNDLRSVESSFNDINDQREELVRNEDILTQNLSSIQARLQILNSSCSSCLPPFTPQEADNFYLLPNVTEQQISNVQDGAETVEDINKMINESLQDIETTIDEETNQTVVEVISELDSVQKVISDSYKEVEDALNKATDAVKDAQQSYADQLTDIEQYLDYRWYFFLGISCSILLVLILMILGFAMGTICYKKGSPRDRSSTSNMGGNCLMFTVFIMFLLFPLLILLTCVMFAAFSLGTSVCTPLETLEIYKETVDYPDAIVDGYYMGHLIYNNGSYNVTISGLLESCKKDYTLYKAARLDYVIDFKELKKEFEKVEDNLDSFIGDIKDIPLDFDNIVPADLEDNLKNLTSEVGINDFDVDGFRDVLSEPITKEPDYLTSYADELDAIARSPNVSDQEELTSIADDLRSIQTSVVEPMTLSVESINNSIITVEMVNETLPVNIDATVKATTDFENALSSINETELAINITEVYITYLIGIAESYFDQTTEEIENDFAKCGSLWEIYSVSLLYTCDYVLNSFNALWFTIGWCVFFFLPSIIFSVKLAKHYRRMKKVRPPKAKKQSNNRHSDEEVHLNEMNGHHGNGYDEMLLHHQQQERYRGGGGMTPVDNPQFIPDDGPIMAYDYKGNPIAPPPAYNYDDLVPCRQRTSLLSPFPWHHPITDHYPHNRKKLWTRQSSSLDHLWPHRSWERQTTIDLGDDDLLHPASLLRRLPRQDQSFEEGKNRPYDRHQNPPYGQRNSGYAGYDDPPSYQPHPRGNPQGGRYANPSPYPRSAAIDMTVLNQSYDDQEF